MALLTWEDGLVKIGGKEIPGLLIDQSVDCQVRFDEQKVDGGSGKKRTPQGWEDAEVSLTLLLTTEDSEEGESLDCYDKLKEINDIFRGHDSKANPKILSVDNRHLLARGISELIFSGLNSLETEDDDTMTAVLTFVENNPPVVKTEKNVAKSAHKKAADEKAAKEAQKKVAVPDVNPVETDPGLSGDLN